MAKPTNHNASVRSETTGTATGDLVRGATEERADFIRAATVGLEYLEAGREFSFDAAAIRLGLDRVEVSSRAAVGEGYPAQVSD